MYQVDGVHQIRIGAHTGNTLVNFDPQVISQSKVLETLTTVSDNLGLTESSQRFHSAHQRPQRGRISAKSRGYSLPVVEALAGKLRDLPNVTQVTVDTSGLQLVIHYRGGSESVTDVISTVARSEGSLDEQYIEQTSGLHLPVRLAGTTVEGGVLLARRLSGFESGGRLQTASLAISLALGAVECAPGPRSRLDRLFGSDGAKIFLESADLCCAVLSGGWLGLVLGGLSTIRLAKLLAARSAKPSPLPQPQKRLQAPRVGEKTLA
jgi:hypothetical protein